MCSTFPLNFKLNRTVAVQTTPPPKKNAVRATKSAKERFLLDTLDIYIYGREYEIGWFVLVAMVTRGIVLK